MKLEENAVVPFCLTCVCVRVCVMGGSYKVTHTHTPDSQPELLLPEVSAEDHEFTRL